MATKSFKKLKELSKQELVTRVRDSEKELFDTKMQLRTGQLADSAKIWRLRKDIARMKMLQTASGKSEAKGK